MEPTESHRLGFTLTPSPHLPLPTIVELAQQAERLGYHSLWIPETWGTDAVSILAVLARETETIGIASGVFNVFSRSAALIAQTAATLSELSDGRFLLGLGTSGPAVVENWHGMRYDAPLARTRDYVTVVRMALAGERVDYEGATLSMSGFRLQNLPSASVPIYIAALGKRNVELSAEIADGWLPIFAARGFMKSRVAAFRSSAPGPRTIAAYIPGVVSARADDLLRQQLAYYIGGMGTYYARFVTDLGLGDDASLIRDAWQTGDRRAAVGLVSERLLAVTTLGTSAAEAASRVEEYRAEEIDLPIVVLPHGATAEEAAKTLKALAPKPE